MPTPDEELLTRFTYHAPEPWQVPYYEQIRERGLVFALELDAVVPNGREKDIALMHLEEVVMWANAGIARRVPRIAVTPVAEVDGAEEIRAHVDPRPVPPPVLYGQFPTEDT